MFVCVPVRSNVRVCIYINFLGLGVCVSVYVYSSICVRISVCLCSVYVCMSVCANLHPNARVCLYIQCIFVSVFVCLCISNQMNVYICKKRKCVCVSSCVHLSVVYLRV